jgi:hypothetical protein
MGGLLEALCFEVQCWNVRSLGVRIGNVALKQGI